MIGKTKSKGATGYRIYKCLSSGDETDRQRNIKKMNLQHGERKERKREIQFHGRASGQAIIPKAAPQPQKSGGVCEHALQIRGWSAWMEALHIIVPYLT